MNARNWFLFALLAGCTNPTALELIAQFGTVAAAASLRGSDRSWRTYPLVRDALAVRNL